jgi:uncharacterized membrane protein YphA (DoxX/SURF4 family)
MSIFFKARGTPSIGLLLIRVTVGAYFLALGIQQASNIETYINRVKAFGMMSENLSFIVGFVLPFVLIVFGTLYIMGFFTPVTSIVLSLVMLGKIVVRGFFPTQGIPFNKDIIFLMCTLLTLFAGAGVLSFDVLLDKRKKRRVITAEVVTEQKPAGEQESRETGEMKQEQTLE